MQRLLLILFLIMFGVTQVGAAPYSLCRHVNAEAHAVALASPDDQIAIEAHREDASAAASKNLASLSDHVAASAATGILPNQSNLVIPSPFSRKWAPLSPDTPVSRTLLPLLQPPSA